jgi:glycosyltransferase involved in cell wall biosynthesis
MLQPSAKPRFLFVHQGYELYGSDRVFLQSLKAIRAYWPQASITVHLPQRGSLSRDIHVFANQVIYGDLWVLHKSRLRLRNWRGVFKMPASLLKAHRLMQCHDATYINTSVIVSYNLASRFSKTPRILHAHEFKTGLQGRMLRLLSGFARPVLIANSNATASAFSHIKTKKVILNTSILPQKEFQPKSLADELNLLLMGRISGWKGHLLSLQALQKLLTKGCRVRLRFVGNVFDNEHHHKGRLHDYINKNSMASAVEFHDFTPDTDTHFEWAHIVLVPSTEPEPFGLVAIEAMARKRPVIAACHGGLLDSIVDNDTGLFFQPRNADDLAQSIERYIGEPSLLVRHGTAGHQRFIDHFQEDRYNRDIVNFFKAHLHD